MPFDEATFDGQSLDYVRTPILDAPSLAAGRSLTPAYLHDLCMTYLNKTAYDGITPEQLVLEYFLAETQIRDFMKTSNEQYKKRDAAPQQGRVQGYKLEDSIPKGQ